MLAYDDDVGRIAVRLGFDDAVLFSPAQEISFQAGKQLTGNSI